MPLSASATSRTSVEVRFPTTVAVDIDRTAFAIRSAGGADLKVLAAYPAGDTVYLTTAPQSAVTYTLSTSAAGGGATTAAFEGSSTGGPIVASAVALSHTEVLVTFVDPKDGTPQTMDATADDDVRYF